MMTVATPEASDKIAIEDIGPIQHVDLPCQPGTVVVLRSRNGRGKSTALKAISAVSSTSRPRLENRDGTHRGEVRFGEVRIRVGRSGVNRRLGDPAVTAVEDDIQLSNLVDPGLKDAGAADLRRIKTIAMLCDVAFPIERFQSLVGGQVEFEAIVDVAKLPPDDVVTLTEKVKRDIESAARLAEQQATNYFTSAKAKYQENEGLDLEAESDEHKLQADLESALQSSSGLQSRADQHAEQARGIDAARKSLNDAERTYFGPNADTATRTLAAKEEALDLQTQIVAELESRLQQERAKKTQMADQVQAAKDALSAAKSHESAIDGWKRTIETAVVTAPTAGELAAAAEGVKTARTAMERGVLIRAGLRRANEATDLEAKAADARKRSEFLRHAAAATMDVMSEAVAKLSDGLSVDKEFRLIVEHPKRGTTYFAELSAGERWTIALNTALEAFERRNCPGLLTIPQEAWEGLDGFNREAIVNHVRQTKLTVYTAEASRDKDESDEISYEVLGAGEAE